VTRPGPLEGLVVLDLTRVLSGPFATMLMADLGARVIKVEPPQGDDSRGYGPFVDGSSLYFARVNRGKESICLDLKRSGERAVLLQIADAADVLVENYRPGVMSRLGLDYETLRERNPALVYASISGFGQTGPWRLRPAYDTVVQASSGLMSVTGRPGEAATKPGMPVADLAAGLYAFGGILAAVHGRQATGQGTYLDVAMHDSVVTLLEGAALSYLATGQAPPKIGNAHYSIAPFDTYRCGDGEIVICAANDALFRRLAVALGRAELATDARFHDNRSRHEHRDGLKALIEAQLRGRSASDWLGLLEAAEVPCGPVSDVAEALNGEQTRHRQMVVKAGHLPVPGSAIKLRDWPEDGVRDPAPALDAHGDRLRTEFGS